ncbi:MAG: hypothetical protein ACLUEK_14325 [Oscillospiraceae bacterium]
MLMPFKYYGGVHPITRRPPVRRLCTISPPPVVVLPMIQQIGAPNKPVSGGGYGEDGPAHRPNDAPVSASVHSSVSGKVIAVEPRRHMLGDMVMSVVIENDFQTRPART